MYQVNAFHCSFCKKHGLSKSNIKKHETACFRNPTTRSCVTCVNYAQKDEKDNFHSRFPFDCTPVCLDGISLMVNESFMELPKVKLQTNCAKWVERPYDEIELVSYQAQKPTWELIVLNPKTN